MAARGIFCLLLTASVAFYTTLVVADSPVVEKSVVDECVATDSGDCGGVADCEVNGNACPSAMDYCGSGKCDPLGGDDFFHKGQFFARGWLDQGFTWNPDNPRNRFNTPVTFNDRANEYEMNQLYLSMGRKVRTDGCSWDAGGRVDLLYGTDYYYTTAVGLETNRDGSQRWNPGEGARGDASLYGLAMPQLYAEFYAPFGYGATIKVGHFYTILGFESVTAPDNFFYSHSYSMQYGEPFTHTGVLASYRLTPQFTLHGGITRGWNTWEGENDRAGFLGGASWVSSDARTCLNFALHTGDEDVNGENNRTAYSLVLTRKVTSRLTYALQHDYGIQDDGAFDAQSTPIDARWCSIGQYLVYDMTPTTAIGFRFEWFYDPENARVLGVPFESQTQGANYCEASVGLNWQPTKRVTLRPELRWDWSDVSVPGTSRGMYDDFSDKNQFTLGTDLIFVF